MSAQYVLGISMSSHDRAAALLKDGQPVAAISEERLDRRKKSQGFYGHSGGSLVLPPMAAITHVLRQASVKLDDLSLTVCGRSITTCRDTVLRYLPLDPTRVIEPPVPGHHLAHAYSAYATSPFADTDVLVIDEQGHRLEGGAFERCTTFTGTGGDPLTLHQRYSGAGTLSLGMFFDVISALVGLSEAGLPAAGKLMALASYGQDRTDWPGLVTLHSDGDVRIELDELDEFLSLTAGVPTHPGYTGWQASTLEDLRVKFQPIRWAAPLAADLARLAQTGLQKAMLHHASNLREATGGRYLSYAGGVALNCTANSLLQQSGYADVFVHPAATDDGCAIGLAAYGWIEAMGNPRTVQAKFSCRLGGSYPSTAGHEALQRYGVADYAQAATAADAAALIADGQIICWVDGQSEWGPRALGGRSILADPARPGVVETLNRRVKYREPFRPFGISVAEHAVGDLLAVANTPPSLAPYMLAIAAVKDVRLSTMQHRDGSIRYQSVSADAGNYHQLLLELERRTGMAAVLNTSFNTLGEPLVESPHDAVRQFLLCGADALWLNGYLLRLSAVPPEVLTQACALAWADSNVDLLRQALQQEAAGYPEAARETAARVTVSLQDGPARIREHAALLMRLALLDGDVETATTHASTVLTWSGMPSSAQDAAEVLANHAGPGATVPSQAAWFLKSIAPQGSALITLEKMFHRSAVSPA